MVNSKDHLTHYIQRYLAEDIDKELLNFIVKKFDFLSLKKNEFLVKTGEICRYFCFVESGVLQHFIDVSGEEKTTYLALKNSSTTALKSFRNNEISEKNIRALSDCKLWVLSQKDFNGLLKENPLFFKFYHNLIEKQILLIDDYRLHLLTMTPEERYESLLANEPDLLQEVPLRHLASFLGISTRHMSRIRHKNI